MTRTSLDPQYLTSGIVAKEEENACTAEINALGEAMEALETSFVKLVT